MDKIVNSDVLRFEEIGYSPSGDSVFAIDQAVTIEGENGNRDLFYFYSEEILPNE